MKNKFCESCRASIGVDEGRVRAVAFDLSSEFYNTSMSGFWNSSHRVLGRRVLALSHGCPCPRPSSFHPSFLPDPSLKHRCHGAGSVSSTRRRTAAGLGWCSLKRRHRTSNGLRFPPNGHAERAPKELPAAMLSTARGWELGRGQGSGGKPWCSPPAQRLADAWRGLQARVL